MRKSVQELYQEYLTTPLKVFRVINGDDITWRIYTLMPYFKCKNTGAKLTYYRISQHTGIAENQVIRHYTAFVGTTRELDRLNTERELREEQLKAEKIFEMYS